MYSFYGGQKGQDFRISRIFSNRSNDLLQDLQARWYSPVNIGDYVLISYGDVATSNLPITNKQGENVGEKSDYDKNLEIDLLNCGKSYTNSIWQKIYVEDNKNISPDFPNSEENVYVFINFKLNEPLENIDENGNLYYTIKDENGVLRRCDKEGNWLNEFDQIIRFKQIPGYSLLETSDVYSEENFGFGYRLIACVTGQTPRIQVFHQTINIEDGDPYVTYDLTNPDKPEIKFYLQRAQRIEQVYTDILGPVFNPNAKLLINKEDTREINGKEISPSLTKPILEFQIPRAIKYFSGLLFGAGSLSDIPFNYTDLSGDFYTNISYIETLERIKIITQAAILLKKAIQEGINNSSEQFVNNFYNYISGHIKEVNLLKGYYFKDISLLDYLNSENPLEDNLPWGSYGFNKKYNINNKYVNLKAYCKTVYDELNKRQNTLNNYIKNNIGIEIIKTYCGSYGFIDENSFNLFDEKEKKDYCFNYLSGFSNTKDLYLIANLFNYQTPIINIKNFILNINQIIKEYSTNFSYLENEIQYVKKVLSQMYYLQYHFELITLKALPGDIYIHTPSGRLYQFVSVKEEELKVNYIGILSAPAPVIESKTIPTFIQNEDSTYTKNNIFIQNNRLINDVDLAYREKFIFNIPAMPDFQATIKSLNNRDVAKVDKEILNINTLNFKFFLPKSVNIFAFNDLKNFNYKNKVPILKDGLNLYKYDFYIHTTYDLNDPCRGWIYMYTDKGWEKQGSILGPIGVPNPIISISLYASPEQPGDQIDFRSGIDNSYYINDGALINLSDTIKQLFKTYYSESQYPDSSLGQIAIIKIYTNLHKIEDETNKYQQTDNYWAQYNNTDKKWYLTLMTAQGSFMSNEKVTNETAKNITYTAEYINSISPEWDVTTYF